MDQLILVCLLPSLINGQIGLISNFIRGGISSVITGGFFPSSLSNFHPVPSPVTSPPSLDTTTLLDPRVTVMGTNPFLHLSSTAPPIYVPYNPRTLNLPKSPSTAGAPYYAYCPMLSRYGDTNVWCFLRMQKDGYAIRRAENAEVARATERKSRYKE